jgi:Protein of unknown function (DUF2975)
MENKTKFVMKPGTREPRKKLGVRDNYKSARGVAFLSVAFLILQFTLNHLTYFSGTIWVKAERQFEYLPNKMDHVAIDNISNLMQISIKFHNWSSVMDPYYFLHIFCTYITYIILFFVCLKIASLFKDTKEKQVFDDKNINTLRFIGFSLFAIPFFDNWAIYVMTRYVSNHPELFSKLNLTFPTHLSFFPTHSIWYFLFAELLYLAVIEIFRQGLELKSENDLTV